MRETQVQALSCAILVLSVCCIAFVQCQSFPSIDEIETDYYTTEVQITDVEQAASGYATEYYNNIDDQGSLKLYFQGDMRRIYYDNSTFQITEIVGPNCTVTDEDISEYDYYPIYYGWLNRNPLVIGPSAALWYAQDRRDLIKYAGEEDIRNIKCDKFTLDVKNGMDDLTMEYYFAKEDWTTPYKHGKLRIPIRIRVSGKSSRYSAQKDFKAPVDQISDFAYFRPTVIDENDLLPPVGIGCRNKKETDDFPEIPKAFQYSAEVVNLLEAQEHDAVEIQFQKVWFDHTRHLARLDKYSKKKGYKSALYDFNTGTAYRNQADGSCRMTILKDTEFEVIDYGMTRRMMEPKEALNLDGTFYDMGKREIRGLTCDSYESVKFDEYFNNKKYYKLVVTVYFTDTETKVGVKGETESRIPVYILISGWSTPENKTLQLQYNIFEFDDVIWPEMYASFRLDRCYTKVDTKTYFVLILQVPLKVAAFMESQDELVIQELRRMVSVHAKVPEMRIPFIKADYKPTGVFVTGVLLERPPALLQFYELDTGPTVTYDPDLKVAVDAKNTEQCSYACVDEGDFLCKGFYFCNQACFLKSTDPFDKEDEGKAQDLGECTEYLRAEIDSTNFRQAYLVDALENLETAVFNQTVTVTLPIENGEEIITVADVVIGEGPYTSVDAVDKPFAVSVELRKLDNSLETVRTMDFAGTLHDCYKQCKDAGASCASFSFCPDTLNDNKECMITTELVVKGQIKDTDLVPDRSCNIYNLKFLDYFIPYPEKVPLLAGDKVIRSVESLEKCAVSCRLETDFKCRGFEYCRSAKSCTLHKKHILDLRPGETGTSSGKKCVHYAAQYIADYADMGGVLIDDQTDVRYEVSLDECAKICSVELEDNCKSFNFCPSEDFSQSTCALTKQLLREDGVKTKQNWKCSHYEKRDNIQDWSNARAKDLSAGGYTKKGFAGLVVGMLALGLIAGALAFVFYSYMKSRSSGEGMAVRFMKNET